MNNNKKGLYILLVLAIAVLVTSVYVYWRNTVRVTENESRQTSEFMTLYFYVQDKEAAQDSSCGVTYKVERKVERSSAVADATLKILYDQELASYGNYKSVSISDGVVRVMLESDAISQGRVISGLSSCEKEHLLSVLNDSLTQYETIQSVELYTPSGIVEF
jgi:hypothetical protein